MESAGREPSGRTDPRVTGNPELARSQRRQDGMEHGRTELPARGD
jgi:hypothetical protein